MRFLATLRALLALSLVLPVAVATQPAVAAPAPPAWPLAQNGPGGKVVMYSPQIRSWPDRRVLSAIAAVAVTPAGAAAPIFGTVRLTSLASADVPNGTVTLVNPQIVALHWAHADAATASKLDALVRAGLNVAGATLPLALVLASVPGTAASTVAPPPAPAPIIAVTQRPTALVVFAGEPAMAPVTGTSLTYATNTTSTVIRDPATAKTYVLTAAGWMAAASIDGPWLPVTAPASFAQLPAGAPFADARAHLADAAPADPPRVYASVRPAVSIALTGQPQFATFPGTQLRYVANTASDLFFSQTTTRWYVLVGGRFYSATNLNGPWLYASAHLPPDFKRIPADGPRGRVLASVPGTTQYFYAENAGSTSHVVAVDPAARLTVRYAGGAPTFAPIGGTALQAATNADVAVIGIDATHFLACANGVWYAASDPTGSWSAAGYVPPVIYTIPSSSPLYPVTFVHIYDAAGRPALGPAAGAGPQPAPTYATFGAGQVSNGVRAAYYNAAIAPYFGGNWAPFPATGFNSSEYAAQRAAQQQANHRAQLATSSIGSTYPPGRGKAFPLDPRDDAYASDDGNVFVDRDGTWLERTAAGAWAEVYGITPTLMRDHRDRLAGYRGDPA